MISRRTRGLAILVLGAAFLPGQSRSAVPTSPKDLKYPPLRSVQIPQIVTVTLPNGMQLSLLENHELPLVRGSALIRTGNLFDPPDKIGLATMTGIIIRSGGTRAKTGDELDEQLENVAASVESSIAETFGSVTFSALKENTDDVLAVFHDVMTNPEFREDRIELAKNQLRSGISRRNDEPAGIASREFSNIIYGRDNPYGWEMEYANVAKIQRTDLQEFYKRYFFPANTVLAIQGDFSAPQMRAKIEKLFSDWNVNQLPVPPFPTVSDKITPGVYVATKTDVTQTSFVIGQRAGTLRDKDYPALEVMADILGGGFHSRLFQRVRTQLGYAYDISAVWGAAYDHPGVFEISGSTKSLSTAEAIKVVNEEIARIRAGEVTADELESAKQTVVNSFVFNFDTPAKTLNRLIRYQYYDYPKDFIFQYQKAVAAVTRADILRVAKQYIDPKNLIFVAVGNPKDFGEPMTQVGSVTPLDITIPEPKAEAAASDEASIEKGKQILRRAQEAAGGAEKLAAVRDVESHAEAQLQRGNMKIGQTNQWIGPSAFRQTNTMPMGTITVFFDGKSGWAASPQGSGPIPEAQTKQMQSELFRVFVPLLLSDRSPDRTVNAVSENEIEIQDKIGNSVRLILDPGTGLPLKETYQSLQPQGPPATVEQTFSDYQPVDGVQLPLKMTITQNGQKFADITVQSYKINSGLKSEELRKKP